MMYVSPAEGEPGGAVSVAEMTTPRKSASIAIRNSLKTTSFWAWEADIRVRPRVGLFAMMRVLLLKLS
jgi:hypothetical protein